MFSFTEVGCSLILGGDQRVDNKSHDYTVVRLDHTSDTGEWLYKPKPKTNSGEMSEEIADLSFENKAAGTTISLNSVCKEFRNTELKELMSTLLLGVKSSSPVQYQNIEVDHSPALSASLSMQDKTSSVVVHAVVVQKNPCTYDFMLVTNEENEKKMSVVFDQFLKGFRSNE